MCQKLTFKMASVRFPLKGLYVSHTILTVAKPDPAYLLSVTFRQQPSTEK